MAEEMEDPTTVTRRSQERHNKQEPVIKGVLPDAPAPIAVPKPEPVAAQPVAAKAPVAAPAPAETGFFGWIKSLFGASAPAPAPVVAPAQAGAKKDDKREGRGARDGERRDGRGGRGGRDGERRDGRRGEGRGEGRGGEGRGNRDGEQRRNEPRAEGAEAAARPEGRNGRGEGRGESRGGEGRNDRGDRQGPRERRDGGREGARDANREADPRVQADATQGAPATADAAAGTEARQDRAPRNGERRERGERGGEGRRERGERGERRNDRGPRTDEAPAGAGATVAAVTDMGTSQGAPMANAVLESHAHQDMPQDGQASEQLNGQPAGQDDNGEGRRDRRSRDRYGRDRRERGDQRPARDGDAQQDEPAQPSMFDAFRTPAAAQPASPVLQAEAAPAEAPVAAPVAAPMAAPVAAAPRVAAPVAAAPVQAAATGKALPAVQAFQLPVEELAKVAESSGLQWVNSDAERIAAAQAAIAAEPKPVHVPRERPPVVVVDEGPLVLVETRRDLREMTLPFEQNAS
jgi:ribonuclease E